MHQAQAPSVDLTIPPQRQLPVPRAFELNAVLKPRRALRGLLPDVPYRVIAAVQLDGDVRLELADPQGNVHVLVEERVGLLCRRPEWYFSWGFNPGAERMPTQEEFVRELVRCHPGLDLRGIEELAMEGPCRFKTANVLSACVSHHPNVEMHDPETDERLSMGHGLRDCTYWPAKRHST